MLFRIILFFVFASSLNFSFARLTSFGTVTAMAARDEFEDSDFVIDPRMGVITQTPDILARTADLSRFPVLAGVDVQAQISRVFVLAGRSVVTHYHPRGLEVFNALRGTLRVTLMFETSLTPGDTGPRKVVNMINAGQSTVFPQGLIHQIDCMNTTNCVYLSVMNTADPGFIPVPISLS